MNIYKLRIHEDDFEYDDIANLVIVAKDAEQAFEIAEQNRSITKVQRNVRWEIYDIVRLDGIEPMLIDKFIHHG